MSVAGPYTARLGPGRDKYLAQIAGYVRTAEEAGASHMALDLRAMRFVIDAAIRAERDRPGNPGKTISQHLQAGRALNLVVETEVKRELETTTPTKKIRADSIAEARKHAELRDDTEKTLYNKISAARSSLGYNPLGHERADRRRKAESPES